MSWYFISAKLNQRYNIGNLHQILKKGFQLNFCYSKYITGNEAEFQNLNIEQASELIIKGDHDDLHRVNVKILDTYATLHILNDERHMIILFDNFSYPWMKKFEDGSEDIDIIKYAKVFLNLIEDYEILEMRINKD